MGLSSSFRSSSRLGMFVDCGCVFVVGQSNCVVVIGAEVPK